MKRVEIKRLKRPAGPQDPRVTEHQGAQSVSVNLLRAGEVDGSPSRGGFPERLPFTMISATENQLRYSQKRGASIGRTSDG